MKEQGSDERLKAMGGMDEVERRLATEEEKLSLEQAAVEDETPATNEPGREHPERPPLEDDAID